MKSFFDGKIYHALFAGFAIFLFYQLGRNDAPRRGHDVVQFIESDMAAVLQNGGNVIDRTSRVQLHNVVYSVRFKDEGWSAALRDRNIATLRRLDWVQRAPAVLCKMGAQVTIREGQSMYRGQGTNSIAFDYSATTVRACAAPAQ
ncbi:hypothetical protein GQ37_006405 [Janthinobacterium sp. BJB1]|uniref:hypothetical protein n=1 Tax=Janthinobacterium sp. GW458P TaxID=1981504 RepID=UPI000A322B8A|nr:hypothetical protein [Janthinobacterium sp. GW458P]MBE3024652.1 hypothetical protein [Janthinobacterium sp. GW458P]PJC99925.1 hypothetical protein GQ37_006405 [Janthinobacterium sp. BJB1]